MKRTRKDVMNKFTELMRKEIQIHHKNDENNDVLDGNVTKHSEISEIVPVEQREQNKDIPSKECFVEDIANYQEDNKDEQNQNSTINLPTEKETKMTQQTQTQLPLYTDYKFDELTRDYDIPKHIIKTVKIYYDYIEWLYSQFNNNLPMIAQAIIKAGKANHYITENGLPRSDLHISEDKIIIEKDINMIAMTISDMLNLQNQFGNSDLY